MYAEWYASCLGHVAPQVLDHSFSSVWMHGHSLPVGKLMICEVVKLVDIGATVIDQGIHMRMPYGPCL